ncbi:aldehyde dehydrogenase family protein [Nocardia aurantiaca]|uniref:aldehyde dehydrogenase family protein n=1 Tax=Nocardia aurantiaca TaxID=2675850 RepID=UPI003898D59C
MAAGRATLEVLSPHDRSVIGRAAQAQPVDVDRAMAAAHAAFESRAWRDTPPSSESHRSGGSISCARPRPTGSPNSSPEN